MTLSVDAERRPIGLMCQRAAVRQVVRSLQGAGGCELVLADRCRSYRSAGLEIPAPLIVRWPAYHRLSDSERRRVSRRVLFARDRWTCQYCGLVATSSAARQQLTVDHVKPAHLFGSRAEATTWENVTTSCRACNQAKGGRLPFEAGMYPSTTPRIPHFVQLRFAGRLNRAQRDYVRTFYELGDEHEL